jgi:hypothetical protein
MYPIGLRAAVVTDSGRLVWTTGQVFYSDDDGETLYLSRGYDDVTDLVIDKYSGDILATGWDGRIYRSTDNGRSFAVYGVVPYGGLGSMTLTNSNRIIAPVRWRLGRTVDPVLAAPDTFATAIEIGVPLSMSEISMAVHPNPSGGRVHVEILNPTGAGGTLVVYDLLGRVVTEPWQGILPKTPAALELDLSGLSAGLYVLELKSNGLVAHRNVVIAR